jgi:hypothetical protein
MAVETYLDGLMCQIVIVQLRGLTEVQASHSVPYSVRTHFAMLGNSPQIQVRIDIPNTGVILWL